MSKSILRSAHAKRLSIADLKDNAVFKNQMLIGEIIDQVTVVKVKFDGFLFADCGMRETVFDDCTFYNCVFAGSYMKKAKFKDCTLRGCAFEDCTTSQIKIENTTIEHIDFYRCTLPIREFKRNLNQNYASNDKMMLNCAVEAQKIGRWGEAEAFRAIHLQQRRKLWWGQVMLSHPAYKKYSLLYRLGSLVKFIFSSIRMILVGDQNSITRFGILGLILGLGIGPSVTFIYSNNPVAFESYFDSWKHFFQHYDQFFKLFVNETLGTSFSTAESVKYQSILETVFRIIGILYLAVLGNLVTQSVSKSDI